jgi:hypothetical protein
MHQYSYFSSNQVLIRIFQNVVILISVWSLLITEIHFELIFLVETSNFANFINVLQSMN